MASTCVPNKAICATCPGSPPTAFDLVWQPYSINFIPDARPVFDEVRRVLRPGGRYRLTFNNPFRAGVTDEDWSGSGYPLKLPYENGLSMWPDDDAWEVEGEDGRSQHITGPKEFSHTLSSVVNGLIRRGFILHGLWEHTGQMTPDVRANPGTWEHFSKIRAIYAGETDMAAMVDLLTRSRPPDRIADFPGIYDLAEARPGSLQQRHNFWIGIDLRYTPCVLLSSTLPALSPLSPIKTIQKEK